MTIEITWKEVEKSMPLDDGDIISATEEDSIPNTTIIRLVLAPQITWWKGIEIFLGNEEKGFIQAQDDDKEPPGIVYFENIGVGSRLVFWKAKTFGIHTPMYTLEDLESKQGKVITFQWITDTK